MTRKATKSTSTASGKGIGLGALTGVVAAQALIRAYGHGSPVVPVGQLGAYLALAGAAGALAAVLPARRLGRLPVVSHLG